MTHDELTTKVEAFRSNQKGNLTGYELAKTLNLMFDTNIPPQMMYNYIRNNLIAVINVNGKKVITKDEAAKFLTKYGLRNVVAKG